MKSFKTWIFITFGIVILIIALLIIGVILFYGNGYSLEGTVGIYLMLILSLVLTSLLAGVVLVSLLMKDKRVRSKDQAHAFPQLERIDAEMKKNPPLPYDKVSLKEFCDEFRKFSAGELGLYYSIEDIRRFIAGLAVSHILILQGMSGTGKTSLAYAFGKFIERDSTIIPIQPMWKERTDLLGYYNEFSKRFNETQFLETIYEANWRNDMFITILDELNIARVEYYFAEFLSLMEIPSSSRYLEIISSTSIHDPVKMKNGQLRLPDNIWFIGTANNDDSTFAISDKVYDRAMVLNLDHKADAFTVDSWRHVRMNAYDFLKMAKEAMAEYRLRYKYKNKLERLDLYMQETFRLSFGNRINKQIEEYTSLYVASGGDELDALDDILSKKVFRKLVGGNSLYLKRKSKELLDKLDELFGKNRMVLCREVILRLVR
jgi:MoxR-like ATPase/uncharacterized membrane protein